MWGTDDDPSPTCIYMFFFITRLKCVSFVLTLCLNQMAELNKLIRELKTILYGNNESEPAAEACAQLTQEFFSENTFRLLIICLPKLDLEVSMEIIHSLIFYFLS